MRLTKIDWIIIIFLLILSLIIFLFFKSSIVNTADRLLIIQSDSTLYATYNLDLLKENIELDVNNPKGDFKVLVSRDMVCVLESGCDDKICNKNIIKNPGESIVCVPYKILIKIVSDKNIDVDSVAY